MKVKNPKLWGRRLAALAGILFMLAIIVFFCLGIDTETSKLYFDYQMLPRCVPYVLLYVVLAWWLFPRYVRTNRIKAYVLFSLGVIVCISVVWSFFIRPHLPSTDVENQNSRENETVIYLDDPGQKKFMEWIDAESLCADCVLDSCRNYSNNLIEEEHQRYAAYGKVWSFIFCFILCFVVFLVFSTIHLLYHAIESERERRELAAERAATELMLLKYQLNPHFLMNTLNNIHALIEIDADKAQESVRLLSKMTRYMLDEMSNERVELSKDVEFMSTYFALMRERFIDDVDIQFNVPDPVPHVSVAPAIFINLAENAFKHGASYQERSYIHFNLSVSDDMICCVVANSKPKSPRTVQSTGYGLEGLRKRLDLLYPNSYSYQVEDAESQYLVTLKIPVK